MKYEQQSSSGFTPKKTFGQTHAKSIKQSIQAIHINPATLIT
jgi:hypothetical protein